jgi:hypothetical protein
VRELPKIRRVGNDIQVLCPCEQHTILFPVMLATIAESRKVCHIFVVHCPCKAYIVTLETDGCHFRCGSENRRAIIAIYEDFDLPTTKIITGAGQFIAKSCASQELLRLTFLRLKVETMGRALS